jgi:predicted RNase H-like HicB family nuclease
MNGLSEYCKEALKLAVVKNLGADEGYSAGFAGLVVFAPTRAEVIRALKSALEGWVELSLERGDGLPALHDLEIAAEPAESHSSRLISDSFKISLTMPTLKTPPCGFGIGSFIAPRTMIDACRRK